MRLYTTPASHHDVLFCISLFPHIWFLKWSSIGKRNVQKLRSPSAIFFDGRKLCVLWHNNNNKSRNLQNSIAIFMCGFSSATTMQRESATVCVRERLISISDEPTKWQTIYILNLTIPLDGIYILYAMLLGVCLFVRVMEFSSSTLVNVLSK